ncbi:hypothetical protein [Pedobacter rhizosphaerae]|uniref:DUF3945 domain-containing protein n=1 Tax=Pedobacter rhizosphaerae TaxID=390241 RepID=A0A1H9SZZ4_9SPHI|nr:hypothetical protein [Pedobacter rhizosphaerae]SER90545.1 hypothetical protein SAMN04488023_12028 [Pedobacter rhizosphaerae]
MIKLGGKEGFAADLLNYLQGQAEAGCSWVVYDSDQPLCSVFELDCFSSAMEAFAFEAEYQQIFNWHQAVPIADLISWLHRTGPELLNIPKQDLNTKAMNLNNLEDRREEMALLGASEVTIAKMEEQMKSGVALFKLHEPIAAVKGQVDVEFYFQKSRQSDSYYLNRFTVSHNLAKPLEKDQHYLVISPESSAKAGMVTSFDLVSDAVKAFKEHGGKAELAIGKDGASKVTVATMKDGKVNYVTKAFRGTFYGKPASQSMWPERGKGFTVQQTAQMIQGHSVFRDDLVNFNTGEVYAAWVKFDMDKGVGANGNFNLQQYHVPQYGFDLSKVLDNYKIKELGVPEKREKLETELKSGMTPLVTVDKTGQSVKLLLEAVPRYNKMNFFTTEGKMEKREQFMTKEALASLLEVGEDKPREKDRQQEVGTGMGMGS